MDKDMARGIGGLTSIGAWASVGIKDRVLGNHFSGVSDVGYQEKIFHQISSFHSKHRWDHQVGFTE